MNTTEQKFEDDLAIVVGEVIREPRVSGDIKQLRNFGVILQDATGAIEEAIEEIKSDHFYLRGQIMVIAIQVLGSLVSIESDPHSGRVTIQTDHSINESYLTELDRRLYRALPNANLDFIMSKIDMVSPHGIIQWTWNDIKG